MKRILTLVLAVVLVASIAVGGTMAYLSDTASDVNVMTLGNVKIEQHEYERAVDENGTYATIDTVRGTSYELVDFTQAKPLLPAVGTVTGWDSTNVYFAQLADGEVKEGDMHYYGMMNVLDGIENVQDKFVFVENTGKSDAYVRTIIAFEAGSCTVTEWESLIWHSANGFWTYTLLESTVNINDNNYVIMVCDYTGSGESGTNGRHPDGIVHPGDWTYNNLAQVYMSSTATNEDVEALDGNKNGTYDILVLSQAVQADGFADAETALNAAFPGIDNSTTVAGWFGDMEVPVLVDTADKLVAALNAEKSVVLTADITIPDNKRIDIVAGDNAVIDLNGYTLTSKDGGQDNWMAIYVNEGATLTLEDSAGGGEIVSSCYGVYVMEGATFTMNGGTINVSGNGTYDIGVLVWNGTFIMEEGTINSRYGVWIDDRYGDQASEVTIADGCKFNSTEYDVDYYDAKDDAVINIPADFETYPE